MYSDVHNYISKKIKDTTIATFPYEHIVIDNIFPENLYKQLTENYIPDNVLSQLKDSNRVGNGYSDSRYVLKLQSNMPYMEEKLRHVWQNFAKYISYHFIHLILQKFNIPEHDLFSDILYVKDKQNYSLGPHTDKVAKVLTCLFYIPINDVNKNHGTSMYLPLDENFRCSGGPHHEFNKFKLHKTIEFIPNRLFCFKKSDVSFHGVEPVTENIVRNLIIFDLQRAPR